MDDKNVAYLSNEILCSNKEKYSIYTCDSGDEL